MEEKSLKENYALSADKHYHHYNMIKGRIAETLIQELFLSLDYNVFKYGMENTIPGIMTLLQGVRDDVAEQIKQMPDFVVQNPKTKEVHFVEVKFRKSETYTLADLEKYGKYAFNNAYIILVSKYHIKCLSVEELRNGKQFTPHCKNYLGNRKEFDLKKGVIKEFCDFAIKFFDHVD